MTVTGRHPRTRRLAARPAPQSRPSVPALPSLPAAPPASVDGGGAWRDGDPEGRRAFVEVGTVELERGVTLPDVRIAIETWGRLSEAGDNVILVEHALTGDSHVTGEAGEGHASPGWWNSLIGPGRPIDPDRWFVVSTNVLGGCQGSTGPSSTAPDGRAWGSRFPYLTVRDQVLVEAAALDQLGIGTIAAVLGGSMGGMRALEWVATHPDRVERAIVFASTAYATADQIAWCQAQLLAIRSDPDFAGGDYYDTGRSPATGLGLARRIAHITYRTEYELGERFGRRAQLGEEPLGGATRGRFAVESYLDHHAGKLARRFDANSYVVLTEAMNSHDIGRGRGGVAAALSRVRADTTIVSVDTDRLYPPRLSDEMHQLLPRSTRASITSLFGHDGFLIEEGPGRADRSRGTGAIGPTGIRRRARHARYRTFSGTVRPDAVSVARRTGQVAIVVGYVATREGRAALKRAADECVLRSTKLVVISSHRGGKDFDADESVRFEAELDRVKQMLEQKGLEHEVRSLVRGNDPAEDLISVAEAESADFIVIGLRRRSPVGKLILGSNAQRILLDASCPVLAVKAD